MHASLDLRARRAELKADLTLAHTLAELLDAPRADVLQRVLHARVEVRQELLHGPFVLNVSRNALRDLHRRRLAEVARRRRVLVHRHRLAARCLSYCFVLALPVDGGRWHGLALFHRFLQKGEKKK